MPRKRDREHPDDIGVVLAPAVSPQQLAELAELGYRGPTPSTQPQAADLLRQWRRSPPAPAPQNAP
jgi:hypothetical protein